MPAKERRGSGGTKKFGRFDRKSSNKRYRDEMRWVTNKAKSIRRHMKQHPNYRASNTKPEVKAALKRLLNREAG